MLSWNQRSSEVANLLNPAFCTLLILETIRGYEAEKGQAMPYSLAFFVLPTTLYSPIREALPKKITTKMFNWLRDFPDLRLKFVEQARVYVPYTKEAIFFGVDSGVISITEEGRLTQKSRKLATLQDSDTEEVKQCKVKAFFIGRWLALAGTEATIFRMWGIQP